MLRRLHKGAYGCCVELAQGLDTDMYVRKLTLLVKRGGLNCSLFINKLSSMRCGRYVQYVMEKIDMLHKYDIKPLLIFDGAPLPKKGHTHADRRKYVSFCRYLTTRYDK